MTYDENRISDLIDGGIQDEQNQYNECIKNIDLRLLKREYKKAKNLSDKLHSVCSEIAIELQPLFDFEISVYENSTYGFVVEFEANDGKAPYNISVERLLNRIDLEKEHLKTN